VKPPPLSFLIPAPAAHAVGGRVTAGGRVGDGEAARASQEEEVQEVDRVGDVDLAAVVRVGAVVVVGGGTSQKEVVQAGYGIRYVDGLVAVGVSNGQIITGRIGNLSGSGVSVIENMLDPGASTNVRRSDIASIEPSPVSPMPEGLLSTLREEEIQDLVAYLLSRGDPESPMYR
jgi:hypothetical protein